MYALCVSGIVNTQGFVWKVFYAIYKLSFIHCGSLIHSVSWREAGGDGGGGGAEKDRQTDRQTDNNNSKSTETGRQMEKQRDAWLE